MSNYTVEKAVIIPDTHIPQVNHKALKSIFNLCGSIQPRYIVHLGDLIDGYSISTFRKNPTRVLGLQEEFDQAAEFWKTLAYLCPNSELHYIEGNHEERLPNLINTMPALSSLRALSIPNLLDLEKNGVNYYPTWGDPLILNDVLLCVHGSKVRSNPGASAIAEYNSYRRHDKVYSGVSGHCHRAAVVCDSRANDTRFWVECGTIGCPKESHSFLGPVPNPWTTACAVATFWRPSERSKKRKEWQVMVDLLIAIDDCFLYDGKMYCPDGVEELYV